MKRAGVRGFTLVELLVVAATVIILATVAVPRAYAAFNASRETQVKHDLDVIREALERHYMDLSYYPNKLSDLVVRGYLSPRTSFKSPVSGHWYFYAVDDNYNTVRFRAKAYALGAPGKDAGDSNDLYRERPLPKGRRPDWKALAWLHADGGTVLHLYSDDSGLPIDAGLPANLGGYRVSCQGTAANCDLHTN